MAISRYQNSTQLGFGSQYGTSRTAAQIRTGIAAGLIATYKIVSTQGNQRLDQLAGLYYNDARYWWILAAASEIGWGLQVPPGTVIIVPDLQSVLSFLE